MVQFGPSDYSLSRGWAYEEHVDEVRAEEREMIRVALKYGVAPRCEINTVQEAEYYKSLGVKHFDIGDQFKILKTYWNEVGGAVRKIAFEC